MADFVHPVYGPAGLAEGYGFYDSVYPVIYCNDELTVVDMNRTATT